MRRPDPQKVPVFICAKHKTCLRFGAFGKRRQEACCELEVSLGCMRRPAIERWKSKWDSGCWGLALWENLGERCLV